ncbi:vitamin K epoxide reductase family protein [Flavobacterium sp.]|uniref:vitamin K epoxide reductase family protein n=1 Tax=Flavobacterium sp. TaxID=239 RepID=UPI0022CCAEA0|nr:vitamin K epoxide reductase family protein [Flavobacterium sp.]MCZ8088995.1 vitamin K epoxide reductase family protein [Flavobacterium sp.]
MSTVIPLEVVFTYLNNLKIDLDKKEFEFQIKSHPDYPSLLSIVDTLNFFKIDNLAVNIDFDHVDDLPSSFIALLKEDYLESQFYFIVQNEGYHIHNSERKCSKLDKSILENRWDGIVLLIEKKGIDYLESTKNRTDVLPLLALIIFLLLQFNLEMDLKSKLFMFLPLLGVVFSTISFKDLYEIKSNVINDFCNLTSSTSCTILVDSKKWKIFKFLDFGDLSITFFFTQVLCFLFFSVTEQQIQFFQIQKLLLLISVPIIFISIYYQKMVEKKWCPICLTISSILVLEYVFIYLFFDFQHTISIDYILVYVLISFLTYYTWSYIKNLLISIKDLKEFKLKGNRFMRNYELFKNTLISYPKFELPENYIVIGDKESKTEITIITNPFCGHCKIAHNIIEKIYETHKENIKINIIINTSLDYETDERKKFFRILLSIYFDEGEKKFVEALNFWFGIQDLEKWQKNYRMSFDIENIDKFYRTLNEWCVDNGFIYTPIILINGYKYPNTHSNEDIEFFINDLLDDDLSL